MSAGVFFGIISLLLAAILARPGEQSLVLFMAFGFCLTACAISMVFAC